MDFSTTSGDIGTVLFWLFVGLCVQVVVIYIAVRLAVGPLISAARDPHWSAVATRAGEDVELTVTNLGPGTAFGVGVGPAGIGTPAETTAPMLAPGQSISWRRTAERAAEGLELVRVRYRRFPDATAGVRDDEVAAAVPPAGD